ncbi:MAG: macrolide ABC transporter ATP-binding protein [Coxiella sp. RIFCSPHIGHO2_12_FULL_44_14]|nr:MAG: macrolide ABC transporter ATP-binding protein [Coxiella sp. RIFCSPHIGHO2_12_FULL_44_14]
MIELRNVTKTYWMGKSRHEALKGVSLQIDTGELVAIMGASGSGKTTTMNILGLLDHPTTGEYYLNEQDVSQLSHNQQATLRNHSIGFVFQSFFLLSRLDALQNVALPLTYRNVGAKTIKKQAMAMLGKVGMSEWWNHRPNELSGGQQQRVAIARALVGDPNIVLADEPTGSLDSKTGQAVLDLLIQLNKTEKTTVIIITHDERVASRCPRVVKLRDGLVMEEDG